MLDTKTRQVLAVRQFERSVAAESEDAYGGVRAANRAVQVVLDELAVFAADAAGRWTAAAAAAGTADGRTAR
jgi:cholesterol transport system auxiliary component